MAAAVQPVRDSQQPDTTQSGDDLITHGFAEPKVPPLQITQTHQSSSSQPTDNEKTTHPWKYGKLATPSSSSFFSLLSYLADTTPQPFPTVSRPQMH